MGLIKAGMGALAELLQTSGKNFSIAILWIRMC